MKTKIIDGVKIEKDRKNPKGYILHIPDNMNGVKLEEWKQKNAEVIKNFLKKSN